MPDALKDEEYLELKYPMRVPPGGFTIEHLEALQGDIKWELIDGVLYMMASPSILHNCIVDELRDQLKEYLKDKTCHVLREIGVNFSPEEAKKSKKGPIPDLSVVCDKNKLNDPNWVMGIPDFIIEVMSPDDRGKDLVTKKDKYEKAGVREYWVVDQVVENFLYKYILVDGKYSETIFKIKEGYPAPVPAKIKVSIFEDCYLTIPVKTPF